MLKRFFETRKKRSNIISVLTSRRERELFFVRTRRLLPVLSMLSLNWSSKNGSKTPKLKETPKWRALEKAASTHKIHDHVLSVSLENFFDQQQAMFRSKNIEVHFFYKVYSKRNSRFSSLERLFLANPTKDHRLLKTKGWIFKHVQLLGNYSVVPV